MNKARGIEEGLRMLREAGGELKEVTVSVGHDVLYAGIEGAEVIDNVSVKEMHNAGWDWSDDYGCWEIFV